MKFFTKCVVAGLILGPICFSHAQTQEETGQAAAGSDPDVATIESMLEKNVPLGVLKPEFKANEASKPPATVDYSQFKTEKSFHDTVIIQKTYMPKTKRVQIFGGLSYAVNDVFSKTYGGQLRAGYHLNETWGIEATALYLSSSDSPEKKDLASVQLIGVQDLITPKSFLGVNAYFSSIYGKMALEDRKIIPFEVYQTFGFGQLNTTPTSNAAAFFVGFGNLFSISKNSAIRADLSWFFYNGKTTAGTSLSANTIFVTIGYGRMVPDARTR